METDTVKAELGSQPRRSGFRDAVVFNLACKETVYFDYFTDSVTVLLDSTFIFLPSTFLEQFFAHRLGSLLSLFSTY